MRIEGSGHVLQALYIIQLAISESLGHFFFFFLSPYHIKVYETVKNSHTNIDIFKIVMFTSEQVIKLPILVILYKLYRISKYLLMSSQPLFAMAQIRRIGHDHQAPFWLVFLVVGNHAVTQGKNKLPHHRALGEGQFCQK